MNKKGINFTDLLPIGILFVVLGIALAYGLQIIGDVQSDMTAGTAEYNATVDSIDAVSTLTSKTPMIVTILIAALVITVLVRYLMKAR